MYSRVLSTKDLLVGSFGCNVYFPLIVNNYCDAYCCIIHSKLGLGKWISLEFQAITVLDLHLYSRKVLRSRSERRGSYKLVIINT